MIELPGTPRTRHTRYSWMIVLLGTLVVALVAMQYRWINQIGTLARASMERDLRVAVRQVAGEIDQDLRRMLLDMSRTAAVRDSVVHDTTDTVRLTLDAQSHVIPVPAERMDPDSVHRIYPVTTEGGRSRTIAVAIGRRWLADSLLPVLAQRVSRAAELKASVRLRIGAETLSDSRDARLPAGRGAAPDADVGIFSPVVAPEQVFVLPGAAAVIQQGGPQPIQWSSAGPNPDSTSEWRLVAWHEAGSLEVATTQLTRRNLLMGFGMMALLTLTGAMLIRTMRREADAALERSAMLAGVSHELRTPLAVIRSAADNMRAGVVLSPTSVAEYGTIVMEHADRLTRAVDQASDIARLIGGRRTLNPVSVHVQTSVAAVVNQMPQAQRVNVACTGVEEVIVDRDVFEAIVRNLVENALAYSAADSPVEVTISRDRRVTSLCVADRGVGISAADRARIFGPFVRGSGANESRRGGLGLGLTIVAQLVDRLGGEVRVEHRSDGGTLFTVTFGAES